MIAGEALTRRSDLQKRTERLQERLRGSVLVQEGDEPPESPEELLTEFGSVCDELQRLIAQINHTNADTRLPTAETVTEGLARRDVLGIRQEGLRATVRAAAKDSPQGLLRYSRSEICMVRQVSVSELQGQIDELAKRRRELDTEQQRATRNAHPAPITTRR